MDILVTGMLVSHSNIKYNYGMLITVADTSRLGPYLQQLGQMKYIYVNM